MRALFKLGVVGAVAATTVVLVRKYDLINRGAELANRSVEAAAVKAEEFFAKAIGLTDELLTQFADDGSEDEKENAEAYKRGDGETSYHYGDFHDGQGAGLR